MSNQITPNPNIPTQKVTELKFPQFISTLGNIPTSYKDSMSYYESLVWLCRYLEETVIPTLNQNGSAVEELQTLFIQLREYVDNYLTVENLQPMIDSKLDEMVTDGTFTPLLETFFQELKDEVNNKIETFEEETNTNIQEFKTEINENITNLEEQTTSSIESFKTEINESISNLEEETNTFKEEVTSQVNEIEETTSSSIETFKNETNERINQFESDVSSESLFKGKSVHFSFDDVSSSLVELQNNNYSTLWEHPFFNMLKKYNEDYNACFSLYVYFDDLNTITKTTYQADFKNAKNWLKIGIHAKNTSSNFSDLSYAETKSMLTNFKNKLITLCGSLENIDIIPRLDRYESTTTNLKLLIDNGIIGLLDRDDTRISYQHDSTDLNFLDKNNVYVDKNYLYYFKTNLRVENSTNLLTDLNTLNTSTNAPVQNIEIFTHEWQVYTNQAIVSSFKAKIDTCMEWTKNNNINFNFIQNKIIGLDSKCVNNFYMAMHFKTQDSQTARDHFIGHKIFEVEDKNLICDEIIYNWAVDGNGTFSNLALDSSIINKRVFINKIFKNATNKLYVYSTKTNISMAITQYSDNISIEGQTVTPPTAYIQINSGKNVINLLDTTKYIGIVVKHTDDTTMTEASLHGVIISNYNLT